MGKVFVTDNGFNSEAVKKFAGPEYFSLPMRIMLQLMFKTVAKKDMQLWQKNGDAVCLLITGRGSKFINIKFINRQNCLIVLKRYI